MELETLETLSLWRGLPVFRSAALAEAITPAAAARALRVSPHALDRYIEAPMPTVERRMPAESLAHVRGCAALVGAAYRLLDEHFVDYLPMGPPEAFEQAEDHAAWALPPAFLAVGERARWCRLLGVDKERRKAQQAMIELAGTVERLGGWVLPWPRAAALPSGPGLTFWCPGVVDRPLFFVAGLHENADLARWNLSRLLGDHFLARNWRASLEWALAWSTPRVPNLLSAYHVLEGAHDWGVPWRAYMYRGARGATALRASVRQWERDKAGHLKRPRPVTSCAPLAESVAGVLAEGGLGWADVAARLGIPAEDLIDVLGLTPRPAPANPHPLLGFRS